MLKMSSGSSPSMEKTWFQDTKTGCEKQAHYFVQIRKLQDELIHREQHNLINAMERLKQITHPRKRPVTRNVETSDPSSVQNFPSRNLNLRKEAKHKALPTKGKPELSPVSGKPLISKPAGEKKQDNSYHRFFVMPPLLTDRDIAKIVHHANATSPSEPSTYLLQPHLPSIPNVGRKTNFMVDNRLKLLTLAESEFCDPEEGSVSGTRKHLHTEKSQRRKKSPKSKSRSDGNASNRENLRKKSASNFLTFDVDPNDPSLFSHCVGEKKEDEQYETTPLPPPNSRPNSTKSKSSPLLVEEAVPGDIQNTDGAADKESDHMATETNRESHTVAPVKAEVTDSSLEGGKIGSIPDDAQISNVKNISSLNTAEGTQDSSESNNDDQDPVEVVVPTVLITNKSAANGEDGTSQEK